MEETNSAGCWWSIFTIAGYKCLFYFIALLWQKPIDSISEESRSFFLQKSKQYAPEFLAKEVFGILVIVHQFHSDKGYWVGSRYQKSLPKCLLICHVETFEVINQEQSPIKGGLFIVSCTNFMSRYGSFGRINCHFNQSDL